MDRSEYDQLKQEHRELGKRIQKAAQELFLKECIGLFDKHPEMESFEFNAYTPYFNDGDECVYWVYCDEPTINGTNEIYAAWTSSYGEKKHYPAVNEHLLNASKAVSSFVRSFDKEDIRAWFGDHKTIKVTREGVTTSHCDHD